MYILCNCCIHTCTTITQLWPRWIPVVASEGGWRGSSCMSSTAMSAVYDWHHLYLFSCPQKGSMSHLFVSSWNFGRKWNDWIVAIAGIVARFLNLPAIYSSCYQIKDTLIQGYFFFDLYWLNLYLLISL